MFSTYRQQWFGHIRADILSGLVVGLALIPEAIAFSIIAGVDPKIGLYASFSMAVVIAIVGGRPAMISAATGAMALLMVTLVKEHGLQYLFATTILTGLLQIIAGKIHLANLMRFVSKSVVIGFVNALAILIFMAQLPALYNVSAWVYVFVALGLAIIYLFPYVPKIGKQIPSPLVCIIVITALALLFNVHVPTVGDMGKLPDTLPMFLIPNIPLNLETLQIIFPYAAAMAAVGLLESMMTATIVDDMTHTSSNKHQECVGQGVANIVTGFMGGMAGCAMIGQSMINIKSGGRGRLSTFFAGVFLFILVVFIHDWLKVIPMAALVAVMIMVSISTFEWKSLTQFHKNPSSSNVVMIATVIVVLATHNLALGVITGVLLSSVFLANKLEKQLQCQITDTDEQRIYQIQGQVFFSSAKKFVQLFEYQHSQNRIVIDLEQAHLWDVTSIETLDQVIGKFKRNGMGCEIRGLNAASVQLLQQHATQAQLHLS